MAHPKKLIATKWHTGMITKLFNIYYKRSSNERREDRHTNNIEKRNAETHFVKEHYNNYNINISAFIMTLSSRSELDRWI